MRRSDREIKENPESVLDECDCVRLGLIDESGAYIVPMNFGKSTEDGKTVLYMHSAKEGKKIGILKENNRVSFQADCRHELKGGNIACEYGFLYKSVFGHGTVEFVKNADEKIPVLSLIMQKYTGKEVWNFCEKHLESVEVIKLTVTDITGKAHL